VGPEAPKPLKPAEGFVPLCHAPCVTLSEEWLTASCLLASAGEPPEPRTLGALVSSMGLGWRQRPGGKDRVQTPIDWEPEARASPQALRKGEGHARARPNP
jgi:hypothetical protein